MIRSLILFLSEAKWAQALVKDWGLARKVARRFVAGETLSEAMEVARVLSEQGLTTTLAHLGEHAATETEAANYREDIRQLILAIGSSDLPSNISLKLTQLGLTLDHGMCMENMLQIAREGAAQNVYIRIDMEESDCIDQTLSIHRTLEAQGLTNVGLVFQSALFRSEHDIRLAVAAGTTVRIVKGAYLEPEAIAHQAKEDIDGNFDRLSIIVLDAAHDQGAIPVSNDGRTPPLTAVASHDLNRIEFAEQYAREIGVSRDALEFQFLYGIRSELQASLQRRRYPVRVYVPYGSQWYPYLMRRLAERPANLWLVFSNLFRRWA
ncbi:MAG: proline dehydrogenase family protein [Anaerolineales bacterium]